MALLAEELAIWRRFKPREHRELRTCAGCGAISRDPAGEGWWWRWVDQGELPGQGAGRRVLLACPTCKGAPTPVRLALPPEPTAGDDLEILAVAVHLSYRCPRCGGLRRRSVLADGRRRVFDYYCCLLCGRDQFVPWRSER
jgi:hypothetical protein